MGTIILIESIVLILWASIATYSAWKSRKVALEALALVEKVQEAHDPLKLDLYDQFQCDLLIGQINHMTDEELDVHWKELKEQQQAN